MISWRELSRRRDAEVHVIGAASAEGVAVTRLLMRAGFTNLTLHDQRERTHLRAAFRTVHVAYPRQEQDAIWAELQPLLTRGHYGEQYLDGLEHAEVVVLGQGWYLDAANRTLVEQAIPEQATVTSMIELYFACAPGKLVGITGTNGKSTTVALVDHLLTGGGVAHRTAGNERSTPQFLPEILDLPAGTLSVLEVSNRQLLQLEGRSPEIAAITSLTPDHLDEHGGFAGYVAAKRRIFQHQGEDDIAVVNADDQHCLEVACASPGQKVACGLDPHLPPPLVAWHAGELVAHGVGDVDDRRILATSHDLLLPGSHNQRNAAVAVAVALACGASADGIAASLRTFTGKALRFEHVADIDGVRIYSDLKSTTPEATLAALASADGQVVLICGGDDKGLDYTELGRAIAHREARLILLPGSASDKLEAAVAEAGGEVHRELDLDAALQTAFRDANPGDRVVVSPAAAGFWTAHLQGRASLKSRLRQLAHPAPRGEPTAQETHT